MKSRWVPPWPLFFPLVLAAAICVTWAAALPAAALPAAAQTATPTPIVAPSDPGAAALELARQRADAGDAAGAITAFEQAIEAYRSAANADGEVAARFFLAMFLRGAGRYDESLTAYESALAAAAPLQNAIVDASLWLGIGDCRNLLKQPADALAAYEKAVALYRASEDASARRGEISALNSAGNTLHALGRYEEAIAQFAAGLPVALALADDRAELMLQSGLGAAYTVRGNERNSAEDHRKALAAYTRGRELAEKLADLLWQQISLLGSGSAHSSLREYEAAYQDLRAGVAIAEERQDRVGEALLRMEAGLALHDMGRYSAALPELEQALALEEGLGNQVRQVLALTQLGATLSALGRNADALSRYEAADVLAHQLGDPALSARVKNDLGLLYDQLGRGEDALTTLEAARQLAETSGERKPVGTALNNLGTALNHRGRYADAEERYTQALVIFRDVSSPTDEAITLNNRAQNYDSQGRYDEARPLYEQALAIHRQNADETGEATVLENLAGQDAAQGRYREALQGYQAALDVFKDKGLLHEQAAALSNLATLYVTLGQLDEAQARYDEALTLRRAIGDLRGEGIVLGNLAALEYERSDYEAALRLYREALTSAETVGDAGAGATWQNHVAAVLEELGRHEEAHAAYQDALAQFRQLGDQAGEAAALNGLGITQLRLPFPGEGLTFLDQAFVIYEEIGDKAGQATALANKAFLQQELDEGEAALETYRQAIVLREQLRSAAPGEELRLGLTQQAWAVFDAAAALAMKLGHGEEAFELTERARSRQFLDQINAGRLDLAAGGDSDLLAREQALRAELGQLDLEARREWAKPSGQRNVEAAREKRQLVAVRQEEYSQLLAEIKARNPQYASMVSAEPASLAQLQALLPPDVTLVSYYIGSDASFAFVIQAASFHAVTLQAPAEKVWQEVVEFRHSFMDLGNPFPSSLSWLTDRLITPVAPYLTTPVVGFAPHGPLHYLPFAALYGPSAPPTTGGPVEKPSPPTPLSERFVLFTLPGVSVLPYLPLEAASSATGVPLVMAYGSPAGLASLANADTEAHSVADALRVEPYLGEAASETALRERASGSRLIHIAAHGQLNAATPLFSRLLLAPDDANDGSLEIHEVYGLDLKGVDLATLSACQTDMGKLNVGDDVTGLSRAFLYAGARSVAASLWSVDDEATAALMQAFYHNLTAGMGKAQALNAAQTAVRTDAEHRQWSHPYYWAAFVLNGDPGITQPVQGPTVGGSPFAAWLPWAGAALALMLAAAILLFRLKLLPPRR